ncbi:MAG: PorT family protein [Prevotella sp.]|nr:PorT family protein [Prevotella sp.]
MMKNFRYFLVAIAAMTAFSAHAQQLKFGVKGGLDLTVMKLSSVHDAFQPENRMGWFAGPTLKLSMAGGLGFDISALYNQRKADFGIYYSTDLGTENGVHMIETKRLKFLKTKQIIVPLNLRYAIGLGSAFNIFGYAGPQVAFRIGDEAQTLGDAKNNVAEWRLKNSNFSVNIGAGITIENLQLSANYNIGLGKTGDVTWDSASHQVIDELKHEGKYNSWQISLAYFF